MAAVDATSMAGAQDVQICVIDTNAEVEALGDLTLTDVNTSSNIPGSEDLTLTGEPQPRKIWLV
jgi:hypothetical protein